LDVFVDCDTFGTSGHHPEIPYLDVSAVYVRPSKQLLINVVNRHRDAAIETDIVSQSGEFEAPTTAYVVQTRAGNDNLNQPYSYAEQQAFEPEEKEIAITGRAFRHSFPPHSFTQIVVGLNVD
jgi:alpha-N-arabinofuranosidase